MRCVPNLIVSSPMNEHYLRHLMFTATYNANQPFVIRYPRGEGSLLDWQCEMKSIEIGKGRRLKDGENLAVLSIGPIGVNVTSAIESLEAKGYSIAHYDMIFLKPIDEELLHDVVSRHSKIVTVEDGVLTGGLGSAVLEFLADNKLTHIQVERIGLPDHFVTHGSIPALSKVCGTDAEGIYQSLFQFLEKDREVQTNASACAVSFSNGRDR